MIVCSCNQCPLSCGRTFDTAEEYRKFCYIKCLDKFSSPGDKVLSPSKEKEE